MTTMNPEVKTKWVKALRSGEYEQGKMALHVNDKFCCLGVLCDLAVREGVEVDVKEVNLPDYHEYRYDGEASTLPLVVKAWAGVAFYDPPLGESSCIALNDGDEFVDPHTFDQIADLIEEYL